MKQFFEKLDTLYQAGDLKVIEDFIKAALDELSLSGKTVNVECASVLNELASFYRGISRYEDSAAHYARALEILEKNALQATLQYATILLNLAGLHRLKGNPKEAIRLFLEVKALLLDNEAQSDYEYVYASVLNNLSLAYQDISDYKNAYAAAYESYQLVLRKAANVHEIATAQGNLAVISFKTGEYAQAETLIDEALLYYEKMDDKNVHRAAAFSTKASLLYRIGKYQEALVFFTKALNLTAAYFGKNLEFATGERNLAMVYEALGEYEAALTHIKIALSLFETILGTENARTRECKEATEKVVTKASRS